MSVDESALMCEACGNEVLDIDVRCRSCGHRLASTGAQSLIGSVMLEHYEIVDILGQGGMSVVYLGRHKLTEQKVALKILPPELAAHAQVKSRFLEEARALAALDHPNIVHLYNFGQEAGCFALAMQFVEGETWERMILEEERLPWEFNCRVAIDVLKALEYAHSKGIIHRDMKPSNVLIRELDGSATVMDFGIAKMTTSSKLTATGQTMGTVRYMSPEQVRGQSVDARTDIYSLGVTLYEAVVGDTPFDGDTHFEIMTKHLNEAPLPPSEVGVEVPPAFEQVLMRTLAKKMEDRPQSARELRAALQAVLENRDIGSVTSPMAMPNKKPRPQSALTGIASKLEPSAEHPSYDATADEPVPPSGKPLVWITIAAVAVIAAGVAVFLMTRNGAAPKRASTPDRPAAASDAAAKAPPAPRWPEPFQLDGMKFKVDEKLAAAELRLMSVEPRDVKKESAGIGRAQRDFRDYLERKQVVDKVERSPLNVQFVPKWAVCDPRVHKGLGGVPKDCMETGYAYRPQEKTLFIAETADVSVVLQGVAASICTSGVSATAFKRCFAAMESFLTEALSPAPGKRPAQERKPRGKRGALPGKGASSPS